jgi:hypothetical protein
VIHLALFLVIRCLLAVGDIIKFTNVQLQKAEAEIEAKGLLEAGAREITMLSRSGA